MGYENFEIVLIVIFGLIFPWVFVFMLWKKRRDSAKLNSLGEADDEIDYEALNKAQEAADKMDLRKELMENHDCIHKFYSLHGVDESYMYELIGRFRELGIHSDFIFVQSLPTGTASYVGNTGTYEFFVERDKLREARSLLEKILNS